MPHCITTSSIILVNNIVCTKGLFVNNFYLISSFSDLILYFIVLFTDLNTLTKKFTPMFQQQLTLCSLTQQADEEPSSCLIVTKHLKL